MNKVTLYGKDKSGGMKQWSVWTVEDHLFIEHGKLNGKLQLKEEVIKGKNQGRSNETTGSQQAELEAQSRINKQIDRGYRENPDDLEELEIMPMLASDYLKQGHRIKYPCYGSPKLNGLRLLLDSEGNAQSKKGEVYTLPEHWEQDIEYLRDIDFLKNGHDGEVFAGYKKQGGLSLQEIVSAFRKPNENTHKLKFYVYDTTDDDTQQDIRITNVDCLHEHSLVSIVPVDSVFVYNEEQADYYYNLWLEQGAEGMMYRNRGALYEYGKRSYNLIKRKPRLDAEAKVLSVKEDKNNEGVLACQLQNGITFECKMRVDSHSEINYRKYTEAMGLIGKFITFEYEELSDAGKPTKPVGVGVRNVDENTWEAIE